MAGAVTQLWRHPIKSHGREALTNVTLTRGRGDAVGQVLGRPA